MSEDPIISQPQAEAPREYSAGEELTGKVTGITSFGAFVKLPDGTEGLVHISEIANTYVTNVENFLKLGEDVKVKVLGKNNKGKYDLSIKQLIKEQRAPMPQTGGYHGGGKGDRGKGDKRDKGFAPGSFDEMMHNFLKNSDEIQLDVRRNLQYKQGVKKKGQKKKSEDEA